MIMELRNRGLAGESELKDKLRPYVPKMKALLDKPKSLAGICEAVGKGNVYRQTTKPNTTKPLLPNESIAKCLKDALPWASNGSSRILTFLCMFLDHVVPLPENAGVVARKLQASDTNAAGARAAINNYGTPVRLIQQLYLKLGMCVVIFQGSRCCYVHIPGDWAERIHDEKNTVVLNIWD